MGLRCALVAVLASPLLAQGEGAAPRRSMADGLVRQMIEQQRLQPPRGESGEDLGAGEGPLVLLLRKADGTFTLHALQRGYGALGSKPEVPLIDELIEVEEIEEVEEVARPGKPAAKPGAGKPAAKPGKPGDEGWVGEGEVTELEVVREKPGAGQDVPQSGFDPTWGKGDEPGKAAAAAAATPASTAPVAIRVSTQDGVVTVAADGRAPVRGAQVDRAAVRLLLEQLFAVTRGTPFEGQLTIDPQRDVPMQHLLAVWESALGVGFTLPLFGGGEFARGGLADIEQRQAIRGIPAMFGWKKEQLGLMTLADGEVLVLIDGGATWEDIVPMVWEFAGAGIWQFGFVVQDDEGRRFKLRTNLPVDKAAVPAGGKK